MSETRKFEDLTKEQQDTVKKAAKKLFFKGLMTGANAGGLLVFSNLIIILANETFLHSKFIMFVLCVAADIYILKNMGKATRENNQEFANVVKQVLDEK